MITASIRMIITGKMLASAAFALPLSSTEPPGVDPHAAGAAALIGSSSGSTAAVASGGCTPGATSARTEM
jgi:hypothetical protein